MSFRFHKSVKLFPGVRINFSRGGLSTTIGVPGASINVGSRGVWLNAGLPGTGLSYRTRLTPDLSLPPRQPIRVGTSTSPIYPSPLASPAEGEIRSAPVGQLTSPGLASLKQLINEAAARKAGLQATISALQERQQHDRRKLWLARLLIIRLLLKSYRRYLEQKISQTDFELAEEQDALGRCAIDLDFSFDEMTFTAYTEFCRAFDAFAQSSRIWDITASVAANRFVERTIASQSVNRTLVRLDRTSSDLIETRWTALRFGNVNGEDLYLYPGFVLMREHGGSFALIDLRELQLRTANTNFIEEEAVPSDGVIIGRTWKKANKDGSRDRRFANNYEIPVVQYGQMLFNNSTGLNEAYMVSNAKAVEAFSIELGKYQKALHRLAEHSRNQATTQLDPPQSFSSEEAATASIAPEFEEQTSKRQQTTRSLTLYPTADLVVLIVILLMVIVVAVPRQFLPPSVRAWFGVTPAPNFVSVPAPPPANVAGSSTQPVLPSAPSEPQSHTTAVTPSHSTALVRVATANIRAMPDANARVISTVHSGAQFTVFDRRGEWVQVGGAGPVGWVHSSLVQVSQP